MRFLVIVSTVISATFAINCYYKPTNKGDNTDWNSHSTRVICPDDTTQCASVVTTSATQTLEEFGCPKPGLCEGLKDGECKTDEMAGYSRRVCCCGGDYCNGNVNIANASGYMKSSLFVLLAISYFV